MSSKKVEERESATESNATRGGVHNPPLESLTCGLVMPISPISGCSAEHWSEVRAIFEDAVGSIGGMRFSVSMVSDADDVGVIQKRIVQNIYDSDIVICDVSCKNSNVMFELGMRLAFDKPTVIVKDDQTDYSFDTAVIEHLTYPRDLRFGRIINFKKLLAEKVLATYTAAQLPGANTFLSSFGTFRVAAIPETVESLDRVVLDRLEDLTREVARLRGDFRPLGTVAMRKSALHRNDFGVLNAYAKGARAEGVMRLVELIRTVDRSNENVLESPSVMKWLQAECQAPEYFSSPEDFTEGVKEAIALLRDSNHQVSPIQAKLK